MGYRSIISLMPKTPPVDADAQAFLTAAAITDPTISGAINTLVVQMKADNIWSKMKAIYPFVGGTASTHKFNLKDPRDLDAAFRLQFNGGWTHSANGAKPNGTNGWANTYLIPSTSLLATEFHLSYYSRTISNASSTLFPSEIGSFNSVSQLLSLALYRPSEATFKWGGEGYSRVSGGATLMNSQYYGIITRTNATTLKYFKNNSILATNNDLDSGNRPNISTYLGRTNNFGNYSDRECAFASMGDGLSDTDAANLYTRVQAFNTALSRQV